MDLFRIKWLLDGYLKTYNKTGSRSLRYLNCCAIALVSACGGGSGGGPVVGVVDEPCSTDGVYVVDMRRDTNATGSCAIAGERSSIAQCVASRVDSHIQSNSSCSTSFGVFVPGTFQEDGDSTQFSAIAKQDPDRTYLSLRYGEVSLEEAASYDSGVDAASESLDDLLFALKSQYDTSDIRVYGHSKGAHAVATASLDNEHADVQFYAFGQAGRTPENIRGAAGYISKLTTNLVTLTWQNDEVKFYTGGANGLVMPEIWGWPGYVNQAGGGSSVFPTRIDHHNNYGGDYTKNDYPYCATGHKSAMFGADDPANECVKQDGVKYEPYFWGNDECVAKAFELMEASQPEPYYIGYSGPRAAGCKDSVDVVSADYRLRYRMTPADQDDCRAVLNLSFTGLDFGADRADGGRIVVSSTEDTEWVTNTGRVELPLHMTITLWAYLADASGVLTSCRNPVAESEIYVDSLKVDFTHPGTGEPVSRTIIGLDEGQDYLWPSLMQDANNVGWRKDRGTWDLHYGIPPTDASTGAVMAKGPTEEDRGGIFYKWVHLVD